MFCRLQIETPLCCSFPPRPMIRIWGYTKSIINLIVLFLLTNVLNNCISYLRYFQFSFYCILAAHVITDIVMQLLLIRAYNKKTEQLFISYYTYTKIVGVITTTFVLTYATCAVLNSDYFITLYIRVVTDTLIFYLVTMGVGAVIQMLMWHKMMKSPSQCEESQHDGIFKADFTMKIGQSSNVTPTEETIPAQTIETTNEKAKLTV